MWRDCLIQYVPFSNFWGTVSEVQVRHRRSTYEKRNENMGWKSLGAVYDTPGSPKSNDHL